MGRNNCDIDWKNANSLFSDVLITVASLDPTRWVFLFKLINYAGAEERGSRPSSERYINIYCLAVHVRSKRTWNGINSRHSGSRQRNWQKIVMPLKSCCFAHYTYCVFWCSYYHRSFIRSLLIHFTSLQFSFAVTRQVAGDFVLSQTQPRGEYEFSNVYVAVIISKKYNLGPVQTSCFCRAELIVIRFDGSTAGKQLWFRRRARVEPNSGFTDTS